MACAADLWFSTLIDLYTFGCNCPFILFFSAKAKLIMVSNRLDLSSIQFIFFRILSLTISIILVLSRQTFSKDALTRFQSYRLLKNSNGVGQCALTSASNRITSVRSSIRCSGHCSQDEDCSQFNFRSKEFVCELFNPRVGRLEFTNVSSSECSHYINVWVKFVYKQLYCNKLCPLLISLSVHSLMYKQYTFETLHWL